MNLSVTEAAAYSFQQKLLDFRKLQQISQSTTDISSINGNETKPHNGRWLDRLCGRFFLYPLWGLYKVQAIFDAADKINPFNTKVKPQAINVVNDFWASMKPWTSVGMTATQIKVSAKATEQFPFLWCY